MRAINVRVRVPTAFLPFQACDSSTTKLKRSLVSVLVHWRSGYWIQIVRRIQLVRTGQGSLVVCPWHHVSDICAWLQPHPLRDYHEIVLMLL